MRAWLARRASAATLTGGHTGVVSPRLVYAHKWALSRLACTTQFPPQIQQHVQPQPSPPPPFHKSARRGWARRRNPLRSFVPPADQATSLTVGSGPGCLLSPAWTPLSSPSLERGSTLLWLDPTGIAPLASLHLASPHLATLPSHPVAARSFTLHGCCNLHRVSRHSGAHLYSPADSAARYWQAPLAELSPRLPTGYEAAH